MVLALLPLLAIPGLRREPPSAAGGDGEKNHALERLWESDPGINNHDQGRLGGTIRISSSTARTISILWLAVTLFLVTRIGVRRAQLAMKLRRLPVCEGGPWAKAAETIGMRMGVRRRVRILDGGTVLPFTAGLSGATIVVPASYDSWEPGQINKALLHEMAHVRRLDVPLMTLAELIAAVLWCNPLTLCAMKALKEDREEACDREVIAAGTRPSEYADFLLSLLRYRTTPPIHGVSSLAGTTLAERRIRGILGTKAEAKSAIIPGILILLVTFMASLWIGRGDLGLSLFAVDGPRRGPGAMVTLKAIDGEGLLSSVTYDEGSLPTAAPLTGHWRVSQAFGPGISPITGKENLHRGIDLTNGRTGDTVLSTLSGTVVEESYQRTEGNYVVIASGAITIRFAKLDEVRIKKGEQVSIGTVIGTVGRTGTATGPHLHYEVWLGDRAIDPAPLLAAGGARFRGL